MDGIWNLEVMELRRHGGQFRNGLAELVSLEDTYLFPMLKSSEIAGGSAKFSGRWMLVPQRRVGDDTNSNPLVPP